MGLAHQVVLVPDEGRRAVGRRDLRLLDLIVRREEDRHRHHVRAPVEPDHGLPVAADRDGLVRDVGAGARPLHVGQDEAAALPGDHLEPPSTLGRVGRVEGGTHGHVVVARVGDLQPSRDAAVGRPGHRPGQREQEAEAGEGEDRGLDAAPAAGRDGPPCPDPGSDGRAEGGPEHGGPHGRHEPQDEGVREQRGLPRLGRALVPPPLAGQADRPHGEAGDQTEPQSPVRPEDPGHRLDAEGRDDVETTRARLEGSGVPEDRHRLEGDREDGDPEPPPASEHDPHGREREAAGDQHEDRVEELLELGDAEGELPLGRRQSLEDEEPGEDVGEALPAPPGGGVVGVPEADARLGEDEPAGEAGEGGPEDHQHVGRAPHRHVDPVGVVPDLVQGEARDGAHAEEPQRDEGTGHPDLADDGQPEPETDVDPLEGGRQDPQDGAPEDHEQTDDDGRMGSGEELLVPAERDVPGDVAVEALSGDQQAEEARPHGRRGPAGDPRQALEPVGGPQEQRRQPGAVEPAAAVEEQRRDDDDEDPEQDQERSPIREDAAPLASGAVGKDLGAGQDRVHQDLFLLFSSIGVGASTPASAGSAAGTPSPSRPDQSRLVR